MTQLPGHKRTDECRFKNMYADDSNLLFIIGIVTYATVLRESNIISGPKTFFAKQIYFEGVLYSINSYRKLRYMEMELVRAQPC